MKIEKNNVVTALRWVLFVPVGVWVGGKAMLVVSFLNEQIWSRFPHHGQSSFIERLYLSGSACFVFGAVAILVSAYIVPRYKDRIALTLAIIWLVLSAVSVLIILSTTNDFWRIWMYVLENMGALTGAYICRGRETQKRGRANER